MGIERRTGRGCQTPCFKQKFGEPEAGGWDDRAGRVGSQRNEKTTQTLDAEKGKSKKSMRGFRDRYRSEQGNSPRKGAMDIWPGRVTTVPGLSRKKRGWKRCCQGNESDIATSVKKTNFCDRRRPAGERRSQVGAWSWKGGAEAGSESGPKIEHRPCDCKEKAKYQGGGKGKF